MGQEGWGGGFVSCIFFQINIFWIGKIWDRRNAFFASDYSKNMCRVLFDYMSVWKISSLYQSIIILRTNNIITEPWENKNYYVKFLYHLKKYFCLSKNLQTWTYLFLIMIVFWKLNSLQKKICFRWFATAAVTFKNMNKNWHLLGLHFRSHISA